MIVKTRYIIDEVMFAEIDPLVLYDFDEKTICAYIFVPRPRSNITLPVLRNAIIMWCNDNFDDEDYAIGYESILGVYSDVPVIHSHNKSVDVAIKLTWDEFAF